MSEWTRFKDNVTNLILSKTPQPKKHPPISATKQQLIEEYSHKQILNRAKWTKNREKPGKYLTSVLTFPVNSSHILSYSCVNNQVVSEHDQIASTMVFQFSLLYTEFIPPVPLADLPSMENYAQAKCAPRPTNLHGRSQNSNSKNVLDVFTRS
eukprot:TRINITY_DN7710_c0_g4_i1.p1 TRINITY_DN7710_c0_g4~~TRINITY_DN7710_c0_g4_i1.p1  ORF type:complete len:153 (+),score=11.17 TRINITY_DN7710_c0_g4_i1:652-1110(+)